MLNKMHRTLTSLIKKHYVFEVYNIEDYNSLIFSFYHLNSVYNGLCYISKDSGNIYIDFQYHNKNKAVEKQLYLLCANIYKLYRLNQIVLIEKIISAYKPLALEIFNKNYSFNIAEA